MAAISTWRAVILLAALLCARTAAGSSAAQDGGGYGAPSGSDVRGCLLIGPTVRCARAPRVEALAHREFNAPLEVRLQISSQFMRAVRAELVTPGDGDIAHLAPFCFPERMPAPTADARQPAAHVHTFAAERPDGRVDHVACLTVLYPHEGAGRDAVTPVCVLVASTRPLYRVCSLFLEQMAEEHADAGRALPGSPALAQQLERFVGALGSLEAQTQMLFADGLHPRLPLEPLLRALRWQGDQLARVWLGALLHDKILIGSSDAAALNHAVHGLQALMLPMEFHGFVMPMLPTVDSAADYAAFLCHAPTAYLVGCDAALLPRVRAAASDVTVVNLDDGSVTPSADTARLHAQLMSTPALVELRGALRTHAADARSFDEQEVRAAFLSAALRLCDPLSDDGALGASRSEVDRATVRHWKLLSGCVNVLHRRSVRLCALTAAQLERHELADAVRDAKLRYLPELCRVEMGQAGLSAAAADSAGPNAHNLPLVAEVVGSSAFQELHAGVLEPPDAPVAPGSGAPIRSGAHAWQATARWARAHDELYVRLRERLVALQTLGHQLLTYLLRCGVRIKLPEGTWVPLVRTGRAAPRPVAVAVAEPAGGTPQQQLAAQTDAHGDGEQVTSANTAEFRRRFAVNETPIAEYDCVLATSTPSARPLPALSGVSSGFREAQKGRLFVTPVSLCYVAPGSRDVHRLPLLQVRRVEKTGGGPFTPKGITVHMADGSVFHFTALQARGRERAFSFLQYLQAEALARANAEAAAAIEAASAASADGAQGGAPPATAPLAGAQPAQGEAAAAAGPVPTGPSTAAPGAERAGAHEKGVEPEGSSADAPGGAAAEGAAAAGVAGPRTVPPEANDDLRQPTSAGAPSPAASSAPPPAARLDDERRRDDASNAQPTTDETAAGSSAAAPAAADMGS